MYHCLPPRLYRAPLDFDLPRRTDSVADALCPDPLPHDPVPASDLDTGALLAEAGVPAHAVRSRSWPRRPPRTSESSGVARSE